MIHVDGLTDSRLIQEAKRLRIGSDTAPEYIGGAWRTGPLGFPGNPTLCGEMACFLLGYDPHKWYTGPGAFEAGD